MTPVFFPFTSISPAAARVLAVCFDRVSVLAPGLGLVHDSLSAAVAAGWAEARIPVAADEDRLVAVVAQFREWAELHGEADLGRWKRSELEASRQEESSAEFLRAAIRRRIEGRTDADAADPLFQARVFLTVAQRFDGHQGEMDAELAATLELETLLAAGLHGDPAAADRILPTAPADLGARMTAARLAAWGRLFEAAPVSVPLVTDSSAVWEAVIDAADGMETPADFSGIPLDPAGSASWRAFFADVLSGTPADPPSSVVAGPRAGVRLAVVPGVSAAELLRKASGRPEPEESDGPSVAASAPVRIAYLRMFRDGD